VLIFFTPIWAAFPNHFVIIVVIIQMILCFYSEFLILFYFSLLAFWSIGSTVTYLVGGIALLWPWMTLRRSSII
jgi:hypothetical protein